MVPRLRLRRSHHNPPVAAQPATSTRSRSRSPTSSRASTTVPIPVHIPKSPPSSASTSIAQRQQPSSPPAGANILNLDIAASSSLPDVPGNMTASASSSGALAAVAGRLTPSPVPTSHARSSPRPTRAATVANKIHTQQTTLSGAFNGEQLASPTVRSASLPFNVYLSSSSSSSSSSDVVNRETQHLSPTYRTPDMNDGLFRVVGPDQTEAVSSPVSTDRPSTPVLTTPQLEIPRKDIGPHSPQQHPARRFLSEPNGGNDSLPVTHGQSSPQRKPQRRTSRVHSLARWYDRLSAGNAGNVGVVGSSPHVPTTTTATDAASRENPNQNLGISGLQSVSLPHDYGSGSYSNVSSQLDDIARLRVALKAEKDARADAEALAASLQNALKHSKKKVDAQRAKIDELTLQVNETRAAIPPMNEILVIAERHFRTKELALKKIIGAQQSAFTTHKDRRRSSKQRDGRRSSTLSSHRLYIAEAEA